MKTQELTKFDYFLNRLNTYKKIDCSDVYLLQIIGESKFDDNIPLSQIERKIAKWILKMKMGERVDVITTWLKDVSKDYDLKFSNDSMALQGGNKNTQLFTIEKL